MQSRYRSPREGFRAVSSANSSGRMASYGRDLERGHPNPYPFSRKVDILMEAGRLAAEYLQSRGVKTPEVFVRKFSNGSPPGFERQARDMPPLAEVRTSALARLGQRFDDEGRFDCRRREKLRKRAGTYARVYDSDWSRENGKSRNWTDRGRAYSDPPDEDAEFPPDFKIRRKGYVDNKNNVSRVFSDELPARSESASEKENYELAEDNWSKASSSSTKKDQQPEADEGSSKGVDEVRVSSSEITEQVKSETSDEQEKKEFMGEDMDSNPCEEEEGDVVMNECKDLLKLCSFTKVPTKPRSSLANKSPKIQHDAEMSNAIHDAGEEECKELNCDDIGSSESQTPESHSHQSNKSLEEAADSQRDIFHSPPDSAICTESLNGKQDTGFDDDADEAKGKDNSCPSLLTDTIEHMESTFLDVKGTRDEEMVQDTNEKGLESSAFTLKAERESVVTLEEEIRPETPASFKICDLNLTGSPELNDIPGGPSMDHASTPRTEMNKGVSADLSMSMRNAVNACDNSQISGLIKVIPVIDLEEDSHAEVNTFDSSKHKGDISYPGLENVLNQATHTDDLPGIQDGYGLEFSEFLGTDMSGCPSAQGDLNDIQPGIGLHGAEGYPGVDDHIYVSLDELPIGFMGVWDQPSQDYEKFF